VADLLTYDDDTAFSLMDDAATVARIVRTMSAEELRATRFADWSAVELLGHLTDVAEVFAERVRRSLEEDTPALEAIPEGTLGDARRDPMDLSTRLLRAHQRIVAYLQTPGAAERAAIHSEWGRVNAGHIAAYLADHSREHVAELARAFPPRA
jgi:hypothetical protein